MEAIHGTSRTLTLPNRQQVNVRVPAGTTNGQVLRLEGLSTSSPTGVLTRTLLLTIIVADPGEPASSTKATGVASTLIGSNSLPTSTRASRRGLSRGITVLLILLVLVLGAGSVSYFAFLLPKNNSIPATPAVAVPTHNTVITPTVPQNPYANGGTLVLNDPLLDNSKGNGWLTGVNPRGATCEFRGGGYYSTQPVQGFFHSCPANNTDFSNFAFEVQMTLISGDYAGIISLAPIFKTAVHPGEIDFARAINRGGE
jgi:hypothetical protein